jgi:hypothetical protein
MADIKRQKIRALIQDLLAKQTWDSYCEKLVVPLDDVWLTLWRLANETDDGIFSDVIHKEL